jgi:histidinol-phosphate aminotransferase
VSTFGPRPEVDLIPGYHSPQVEVEVRLNTNESAEPPPPGFSADLAAVVGKAGLNRYPDREARELREAIGSLHGVGPEQVWCGNGSNEVLQALLLAFGGPGRSAAVFEPTYALHSHISRLTATTVVAGERASDFTVSSDEIERLAALDPAVMFLCSPNNPTGGCEPPATVTHLLEVAPGLTVVDEAYGQFAPWSGLELLTGGGAEGLAVVRTFSKTWALAGLRLGYLVASPEVVEAAAKVTLPYHLDTLKQVAGVIALSYEDEMKARVAAIVESRAFVQDGLAALDVESWPSEANFVLFRPRGRDGGAVWQGLLDRSVLVRYLSAWPRLAGCLRVTIGTRRECERFLEALAEVLEET